MYIYAHICTYSVHIYIYIYIYIHTYVHNIYIYIYILSLSLSISLSLYIYIYINTYRRKKFPTEKVSMGEGQEKVAREKNNAAFITGGWVILQNCHLGIEYMCEVGDTLTRMQEVDEQYRLWITCEITSRFPIGLLQMAIKVRQTTKRRTARRAPLRLPCAVVFGALRSVRRILLPARVLARGYTTYIYIYIYTYYIYPLSPYLFIIVMTVIMRESAVAPGTPHQSAPLDSAIVHAVCGPVLCVWPCGGGGSK